MIRAIRPRLTYANVTVTVLLFVVLGAGAYAAFRLPKNSVRSKHIVNGQVKAGDLAADAATGAKVDEATLEGIPLAGIDGVSKPTAVPINDPIAGDDEPATTQTLFDNGTFNISGSCEDDGSEIQALVTVFTDETPNRLHTDFGITGTNFADTPAVVADDNAASATFAAIEESHFTAYAANGGAVSGTALAAAGPSALGDDCLVVLSVAG
jgi:hypothetical protein